MRGASQINWWTRALAIFRMVVSRMWTALDAPAIHDQSWHQRTRPLWMTRRFDVAWFGGAYPPTRTQQLLVGVDHLILPFVVMDVNACSLIPTLIKMIKTGRALAILIDIAPPTCYQQRDSDNIGRYWLLDQLPPIPTSQLHNYQHQFVNSISGESISINNIYVLDWKWFLDEVIRQALE